MRTRLPGRKRSAGSPKKITYRALFSDGGFLLVLAGAFWGNVGLWVFKPKYIVPCLIFIPASTPSSVRRPFEMCSCANRNLCRPSSLLSAARSLQSAQLLHSGHTQRSVILWSNLSQLCSVSLLIHPLSCADSCESDKFGILNLMVPLLALSAMLVWVLLACNNAAGIVCFAVFYGFTSGSYVCECAEQ